VDLVPSDLQQRQAYTLSGCQLKTFMLITPMQIPEQFAIFPAVNATLNGTSAVLLLTGRWFIVHGRMAIHRAFMIAALITSSAFLCSYLFYLYSVVFVNFVG
jgi:uncharacterized membrane protein YozB (DUF420 family)